MTTKLTILLGCFVAVARAGILPGGPVAFGPAPAVAVGPPLVKSVTDYDPHPQYSFAYNVHDSLTGDAKSQHETRNGDVVTGSYSLIEADGSRRVVEYTADPVNGFNAVVHREPLIVKAAVPAHPALVHPPISKFSFHQTAPTFAYHH